jgi:gliding motility-associated-like protein
MLNNLYSQENHNKFHSCSNTLLAKNKEHFLNTLNELRNNGFFNKLENDVLKLKGSYQNENISFEDAISLVIKKDIQILNNNAKEKQYSKTELVTFFYNLEAEISKTIYNSDLLHELEVNSKNETTYVLRQGGSNNTVQQACTNVDFADGTTSGWTGSYGNGAQVQTTCASSLFGICLSWNYANDPTAIAGFSSGPVNSAANSASPGVHTIMTGGTDPVVPISVTPPGGGNSIRLGNRLTGDQSQRIRQTFNVSAGNPNFVYQYAVVLEDNGHGQLDQPYFHIRMYDANNNLINCATYDVDATSAASIGGFLSLPTGAASTFYRYKDWSTVTVPLLPYVGTNVTIEFTTSDCTAGGHAGYAYIQCLCSPIPIVSSLPVVCNGQTTTLTAPAGAASYTWTGPGVIAGVNTNTALVNVGGSYTVNMTTFYSPPQIPCVFSQSITLGSAPGPATPSFSATTVCLGTPSNFTDLSTGSGILTYSWNYGDASTGITSPTSINPSYTYTSASTYTASLIVDNGCPATYTLPVTVLPQPTASFNLTNNCLNASSNFTSTSTPTAGIASQIWTWGDASANGSGTSPSHTYSTAGTYSVKLVVTAAVGSCTASVTNTITVYPKPIVTFTANPVCLNSATNFTNSSTITAPGTINAWAWDFDNNGTTDNTTQTPSNTYTPPGTYSVELKATSSDGCSDSLVVPIVVKANPTATFTPVAACVNANVLLNNTSAIPLPNTISLYDWSFGTGSTPATSSNQNPPSLTYNASGVKTITLTVTANNSCTATVTNTVTINPSPVANFSTTSVCQSTATAFTDMSTTTTGTINVWSWDFTNDGSVDNTTQNPTFTYPLSGTFTAALTVSTTVGCANTFTAPLNVWGHTIPDFSPDNVCFGTATTFNNNTNTTTNANVGTTPTYSWNFADGSGVQVLVGNPSHTYSGTNVNASYSVALIVTSSHACIDSVVKTVNVYAIPTASFTADSVCLGSPSHMLDASNGNGNTVNNYMWDFLSNGTIDATGVSNPNFTFPAYGNNVVTYTASTTPVAGLTCQNITSTITVWVNPIPVPNFTFVNKCINAQPNTFDASSSNIAVGTNTAYTWAFGDGATSPSTITPTHTFVTAGLYNTTLTVTSNKGCQLNVAKQVEVYQKPLMSITASSACFKSAMTFTAVSLAGSGTVNSWSWDFNNTIASYEGYGEFPNYNFPAAGSQTVHLVASTTHGCSDTFTTQVYVDYLPTPAFTVDKPSGCPLHCVKFTDNTPVLSPPGINNSWQWVFGDGATITSSTSASQSHCYDNTSYNQSALFDVKLIVTSNKGCKDSLNKPAFITVFPTPIAQYTVDPNPGSIVSPVEQFTNQSLGFTKVWWCFGDGPISDTTNINPLHFYNDINAADYYSYLIVANQYGCRDTANVKVEIAPEYIFYIPNAFTPDNGDGVNDFFTGMGVGIATYEMWIFDRWGVNIFYSDDIYKGWNGKVQGKDALVQQDVYVWKVKIKDVLGKKHDYVGHVTVLR